VLKEAARGGHGGVVKMLIEAGADVNAKGDYVSLLYAKPNPDVLVRHVIVCHTCWLCRLGGACIACMSSARESPSRDVCDVDDQRVMARG
jgi:hypothetical protein